MRQEDELCCIKTDWRGRLAYKMTNGVIQLVTLMGGGHIAELRFSDSTGSPSISPLWVPPWKTIEPFCYRPKLHASRYGSLTEGKLLSGLVGHNICLDYFGPPSPEEAKEGLSQHGEAPSARWQKTDLRITESEVVLTLSVRLPTAGLELIRKIMLRRGECVVYFSETVLNLKRCDHFFHWTQHVTLGPPFLSRRNCRVAVCATRGITSPHGYDEGKTLLAPKREFRWSKAPTTAGGMIDLRTPLLQRGAGFVASLLVDPRRRFGFVAALNTRHNLLIGYCFDRHDFPWVAIWEENQAVRAVPWKRRTQARGLEFGTTPLPLLRRESFAAGSLFGTPTFAYVPARGRKTIDYVAFVAHIPSNVREVTDVRLGQDEILIYGRHSRTVARLAAQALFPTRLFAGEG